MHQTNEPVIPSTRVNGATTASGSKPRSNTKKDMTLPAKSDVQKVEVHPRNNKSSVKQKNCVDSSISYKRIVINSNSNFVCKTCNKCLMSVNHDKCVVKSVKSVIQPPVKKVWQIKQVKQVWQALGSCSKHMTGDRSRLKNFVKKFIMTVRFENDHFGAIMGYGDYVIGDSVISRHCRTTKPHFVEAARTMLIFSKALMFLWTEAVATACYTQNRSLIHTLHNKTSYELVHDKKPDLSFLHVFCALYYPTNDSADLGKLKAKADMGLFVGYALNRKGYRIYNKRTRLIMETIHATFDKLTGQTVPVQTSVGPAPNLLTSVHISSSLALQRQDGVSPAQISSGLVAQPYSLTPNVPPTKNDWDMVFCLIPSSTRIDQDTPSTSTSQTTQEAQSYVILTSVEEDDH
nr:retrovirus-related Pol polyprotein from transposon TNT 1-94 [Tanacetum cinerariifolium]